MDDCGTDAEAFSSNMEFIYNGASNNCIQSRDIDIDIDEGENGLEIKGYDPRVTDSDCSDVDEAEVIRQVRQVSGIYSNATIEELHATASTATTSRRENGSLQAMSKLLRDESRRLLSAKVEAGPQAGPQETPETLSEQKENVNTKKSRRRRARKNVAIQSILGIRRSLAEGTESASSVVQAPVNGAVTSASSTSRLKPSATIGLTNGSSISRGRGKTVDKSRSNFSMIRPECIHGYDGKNDYDPIDCKANFPFQRDDFPPL